MNIHLTDNFYAFGTIARMLLKLDKCLFYRRKAVLGGVLM